MVRSILLLVAGVATLFIAACSSSPVRRISEPAASVQQLTVQADGTWQVVLRLQNYSSIPMRFERVDLGIALDGDAAGRIVAEPGLAIGPGSADVITVTMVPTPAARIRIADVLAGGRSVPYTLDGTLHAAPEDRGGVRAYPFARSFALSPVPGLPGALR